MPIDIENTTYYNTVESAKYVGVSMMLFQKLREQHGLCGRSRGYGKAKFYSQGDLDKLRSALWSLAPEEASRG